VSFVEERNQEKGKNYHPSTKQKKKFPLTRDVKKKGGRDPFPKRKKESGKEKKGCLDGQGKKWRGPFYLYEKIKSGD